MNFREAESYLLSLGNEVSSMKLGLENTVKLLDALGNPQKNYLKVQVAGTNGKGSVCAFLKSICLEAGIKAGVYTSPHLVSVTERMNIRGVDISEDEFAKFATKVRETAERLVNAGEIDGVPTFFEQVTAIALLAFADARVELAILETGLGGRLDATTAARAEIAAITRIDFDHQKYLGETLAEIAAEKAAIIHEGSKIVIGDQSPEAELVILERCVRLGVYPTLTSELEVVVEGGNTSRSECVATPRTHSLPVVFPPLGPTPITLGFAGRHQIENAMLAIRIAQVLQDRFPVTAEDILVGLENARHPGRLEFIGNILLDGAHNVGGAKALRTFLDEFVDRPITLIFGAMNDKDVGEMAEILFPKANRIILTQAANSRAMAVATLAEKIPSEIDREKTTFTYSVEEALEKTREISANTDLILVTGSLYLVGEVIGLLNN